jgi:AraC family transcriptional regulator, regulatory protein of adaptative response / methylated-DNA-[protein]-cysteine methyltransferase
MSPATRVLTAEIDTPISPMFAAATESHLLLFEFEHRRIFTQQIERMRAAVDCTIEPGESPIFPVLRTQLDEYFRGERKEFTVPLRAPGTPFQERVWSALLSIPYGETTSYARLAISLGQPTATRAVARANGDNRIAILIPCHRVIGTGGQLVGYGGGLWRKKKLLELEGRSHTLPLFAAAVTTR